MIIPAVLRDRRDPRPRAQRAAAGGDLLEQRARAVEVAEEEVRLASRARCRRRREPAAGLERGLQEHAEGHRGGAVSSKYQASSGTSYSTSTLPPGLQGAHRPRRPRDARHEVVGRPRQARDAASAVEGRVQRAEGRRGPAQAHASSEARPKEKPSTDATGFGST